MACATTFLPELRKSLMAAVNSASVGWPPPRHVVEVEHHGLDARIFLRGLERVDEIPEQGFGLRVALRARQRLVDRAAGELLDDLALGRDDQRRVIRDARNRGTQGSDDEAEDRPAAAPGAGTCAARRGRARCRPKIRPIMSSKPCQVQLDLLFDARGLAGQVTQVVQLGAAHAAAALDSRLR